MPCGGDDVNLDMVIGDAKENNLTPGERNALYPDGVPCTTSVLDHLDTVKAFPFLFLFSD